MADENDENKNVSVSVPMGAIATALVLGMAAAAYALIGRDNAGSETGSGVKAVSGLKAKSGSMRKKLGLMTLITVIENDASRKVLLAFLRAMARRS
jgi:hypothetical protein